MDVAAFIRVLLNFSVVFDLSHIGLENHVIQRQSLFSGSSLHNGSQEGHRIEQVGNTHTQRSYQLFGPFLQLSVSIYQIIEPENQRLFGRIGYFGPILRHFVDLETLRQGFHGISHIESTSDSQFQVFQRLVDFLQKEVHSFTFLDSHHNMGSLFLDSEVDFNHIVIRGNSSLVVINLF